MISLEDAKILADAVLTDQKAVTGCDAETAEEVEAHRLALLIKKIVDHIQG